MHSSKYSKSSLMSPLWKKGNCSVNQLYTPVYFSSSEDDSLISTPTITKKSSVLSKKFTKDIGLMDYDKEINVKIGKSFEDKLCNKNFNINSEPKSSGESDSDNKTPCAVKNQCKKFLNDSSDKENSFDKCIGFDDSIKVIPQLRSIDDDACLTIKSYENIMNISRDDDVKNCSFDYAKELTYEHDDQNIQPITGSHKNDVKSTRVKVDGIEEIKAEYENKMEDMVNAIENISLIDDKSNILDTNFAASQKFHPIIFESDNSSAEEEFSDERIVHGKEVKKTFLESLSKEIPANEANQEALKYRENFTAKRFELTKKLFHLFNEKIFDNKLPEDMSLEWNDRLLKTAGYARNCLTGGIRTTSICLSTKVLDSASRLRDTLLHEMCHSAVWIVSGLHNGHGPMWKTWALRSKIAFPEISIPSRCHNYEITYKYTYKCSTCGNIVGRHSKSIKKEKHTCSRCHGTFQLMK